MYHFFVNGCTSSTDSVTVIIIVDSQYLPKLCILFLLGFCFLLSTMYIHFSFLSVYLSVCYWRTNSKRPKPVQKFYNHKTNQKILSSTWAVHFVRFFFSLSISRLEERKDLTNYVIISSPFSFIMYFFFFCFQSCVITSYKKKNCSAPNKNSQIVNFSYSGYFHNNPCAGKISKEPYLIFQSSPGHTYVCVCMCCYACLCNWSIFSKVFPSVSPSLSSGAPFLSLPVFSLISIIEHLPGQLSHGLGPSHFTSKTVSHWSWRRTVPTLLFCIHWVILCWHIMYVHSSTCVIIHLWFWVV